MVTDVDKDDDNLPYRLRCYYSNYDSFHITPDCVDSSDYKIIKKLTNEDIEDFCKENQINFRVGEIVTYNGIKDIIKAYDLRDGECYLEEAGWVGQYLIKKEEFFEIGDLLLVESNNIKSIVEITNIDKSHDTNYTYQLLGRYYDSDTFWDSPHWKSNNRCTIIKKATNEDIEDFCEKYKIKYRVGDSAIFNDEEDSIICYDINRNEYLFHDYDWQKEEDILPKLGDNYKNNFKEIVKEVIEEKLEKSEIIENKPKKRLLLGAC
jgi:hypothetical protein